MNRNHDKYISVLMYKSQNNISLNSKNDDFFPLSWSNTKSKQRKNIIFDNMNCHKNRTYDRVLLKVNQLLFLYDNTYILFTIKRIIAWHFISFC
jgi:hypothetical protein